MINLIAVSDLHLGFDSPNKPFQLNVAEKVDLVLMAGDIIDGCKASGFDWVLNATNEKPVLITLGNHELYGTRRDKAIKAFRDAFDNTHVQFLLNESIVFNNIRFCVTDLWTDFALFGNQAHAMKSAESMMNDYRRIKVKIGEQYRKLKPIDTMAWHQESRVFIEKTLNESKEAVVLMTHHGVSRKGISPIYQGSPLNPAFASDLEPLFESAKQAPILSIFGHSHAFVNEILDCGTVIYCNARGYNGHEKVEGFDPTRIISIDENNLVSIG
ncbi:MAG: hypothetical protein COA86_02305 [Kangiella sp.]|nr:MAG: hypothetical protein COA86_02305 [Kangiella sp.]